MPSWKSILANTQKQDPAKAPPHVKSLQLYDCKLTTVEEGRVVFNWPVSPEYMNPVAVFGGYLAALADQTCSYALMTVLEDDQNFTTIDLKTNFFRPVTKGIVRCEGVVINRSRSQAFVEATFTDENGKLLLKASAMERILSA